MLFGQAIFVWMWRRHSSPKLLDGQLPAARAQRAPPRHRLARREGDPQLRPRRPGRPRSASASRLFDLEVLGASRGDCRDRQQRCRDRRLPALRRSVRARSAVGTSRHRRRVAPRWSVAASTRRRRSECFSRSSRSAVWGRAPSSLPCTGPRTASRSSAVPPSLPTTPTSRWTSSWRHSARSRRASSIARRTCLNLSCDVIFVDTSSTYFEVGVLDAFAVLDETMGERSRA